MKKASKMQATAKNTEGQAQAFSFGDPTPVLDGRDVLECCEAWRNGKWYEPPVSRYGLAKSFRAATHHSSAIYLKRNILVSTFKPHPLLSRSDFSQFALDYLVFGDSYMERITNRFGKVLRLKPPLAKYMRRGADDMDVYFSVLGWKQEHQFDKGSVFQLMEPDINQEIYGLPEYLASLQSAWLNESSTLFRRKYYLNGSHAGYILYMTDALSDETQIDNLKQAMKDSKGPGNFRNMMLYAPGGKKDGIQIMPVSEVAAKDDFFNIKNVTRDDMLAGHRVPPQLLGLVPTGTSGFGSVVQAAQVFSINEIEPLQARMRELNDWVGQEVVQFDKYAVAALATNGATKPKSGA
jgi:PBSX family phage portal protein